GEFRLGDIRHNAADLARVRKALGFSPRWSFARGIAQFLHWAEQQAPPVQQYERSLEEMKARNLLQSPTGRSRG
ncbi:MAG: epimerase, partial [Armatimonadetes bacterium]|nr:epimerase [Armatimonadota bacterium]